MSVDTDEYSHENFDLLSNLCFIEEDKLEYNGTLSRQKNSFSVDRKVKAKVSRIGHRL